MPVLVLFLQAAPEGFFPGRILPAGLTEVIFPESEAFGDHLVDHAPVWQAAKVAVIDEQVGLQLAWGGRCVLAFVVFLWMVAVDGVELQSTLAAPVNSILQEPAFADRPKDQGMMIRLKTLEGVYSERDLLPDLRVLVFHNGSVKIDCYYHCSNGFYFGEDKFLGFDTQCNSLCVNVLGSKITRKQTFVLLIGSKGADRVSAYFFQR